ncbi:hypothetical protein QAD02_000158 [Eretmocerus hayati]|uniref:Uncharacterized protein n=1 Tax=Eretmocerus hayati TaxID=131215 RepID=A0ACC2NEY5_9HYME|nr:hypothetical protein QAD02_000158 [Eretmocerus hayati]
MPLLTSAHLRWLAFVCLFLKMSLFSLHRSRNKKVPQWHRKELIRFLQKYPDFAQTMTDSIMMHQLMKCLNQYPPLRTETQWRKTWYDMAKKVKDELLEHGGDPKFLSIESEAIYSILVRIDNSLSFTPEGGSTNAISNDHVDITARGSADPVEYELINPNKRAKDVRHEPAFLCGKEIVQTLTPSAVTILNQSAVVGSSNLNPSTLPAPPKGKHHQAEHVIPVPITPVAPPNTPRRPSVDMCPLPAGMTIEQGIVHNMELALCRMMDEWQIECNKMTERVATRIQSMDKYIVKMTQSERPAARNESRERVTPSVAKASDCSSDITPPAN